MTYTTPEMAEACRTTVRGVRFWETNGLFGPVERNDHGDRVFTEEHLRRGRLISAALAAGMSHREIRVMKEPDLRTKIAQTVEFLMDVSKDIRLGFDL